MGGVDSRDALSKYMENLHTEYADEVGLKYGMERGDSIKETGAVHRTTEEYRRKLWKDAQEKEEEVRENAKTIEQQNSTITNQRGIIASLNREIKHSAARLKALATMIKNLETHKADLEQEIKNSIETWLQERFLRKRQTANFHKSMPISRRQKRKYLTRQIN